MRIGPEAAGKVIGEKEPKRRRWGWKAAAAVAVLILLVGGLVWNFYWRAPKIEPASKEKMAFPLPDKPSIAVLAFTNMSGDPKDDLLGDGLAEGIINGLAKSERILVIARNSTFTYKGKPVKLSRSLRRWSTLCDRREHPTRGRASSYHRPARRCADRTPPILRTL